jgi:hypothetical protein
MDIDNKLNNYLKITGIVNKVFRPNNTLKKTRIKLYSKIRDYKRNWIQHVNRMPSNWLPRLVKTTAQQAEEPRKAIEEFLGPKTRPETGTGQQVAQLHDDDDDDDA